MVMDSIIFDLDGTLWDFSEGFCSSWNSVISKYPEIKKVLTVEDVQGVMGLEMSDIIQKLFPEIEEKVQAQVLTECSQAVELYLLEHGGKLFPKLEETLKKLSEKYKLLINSNCEDGYIQCFFKAHKLKKYFTDFECWGVTGLSKGENNKILIERNQLRSPVFVGDTKMDAESARVAGIPFVYARYGFGNVEKYDYVIDGFEEILTLETY